MLGMRFIFQLLGYFFINEVYISHSWRVFYIVAIFTFGRISTVNFRADRHSLELHYILSESTSLVTEDIMNHT